MQKKIYAILGGGDWYDASVKHLILPEGMDLKTEQKLYEQWYREVYAMDVRSNPSTTAGVKYMDFEEFLISKGAREPTNDELELFSSDW